MNKYLTLCIFIIFVSCSSNKQTNNHKELVILGAVHFPTGNVNADSIVSILERVSPDCILMEVDSSIFKADFTFKKTFDENEFNAALKYKEKYPNVKLRPIEFEGRNQYRKLKGLYSGAGPTFRILNELNRANEFNKKEQEIWERFTNFYEEVENIGTKNLKTINSSITDEIVDSLKLYQYVHVKKIIDGHKEFKNKMIDAKGDSISINSYFEKWTQFEYKDRNSAMAQNVIRTINSFPNKQKFLLMVGFHHRFYIKKVIENKDSNIEIIEFYK